jgi:hypothetical protein
VPRKQPATIADNDTFVTLIQLAREDAEIRKTIQAILSQPPLRKAMVKALIDDMTRRSAPVDFVTAVAALLDDEIARRAGEII